MNLSYAVIPILGILAFTYFWNRFIDYIDANHPGWRKTPNFFSLSLAMGITLFATQILGAIVLDPLALDKIQVTLLKGAFDSSETCTDMGYTPVLSLSCQQPYLASNYTGIGRIPYGENASCICSWALAQATNESIISIKED